MRLAAVVLSVVAALMVGSIARGAKVAHYSFNEGFGTTSTDSVGGYVGTLLNGAFWDPKGVSGGALALDDVNDYFDGNTDPSFLVSQGSLELWYKLSTFHQGGSPGGMPYSDGASWDNPWVGLSFHLQGTGDGTEVRPIAHTNVNGPGGYKNAGGVFDSDLEWVHLAATNDGTTLRFYRNGVEAASTPTGGPILYSGSPHLAVGVRSTSSLDEFFPGGLIDEVALYNNVLTPEEVLDHYNNPISGFIPGDVNFDGVVNIFDINLVSAHWGEMGPTGDANSDMIVNIFDINLISTYWTPTGSAAAVPEPGSFGLAALALTGVVWMARRPSQRARRS